MAEPASTGGGAGTPAEVVELPPGEYNRTVRVGPRQRTFTMVVPVRRPASQAVPLSGRRPALVVLLHGVGATAATFRAGAGFDGTAASLGAVAVYPDGVEGSWNDGRANVDSTAHREPVDDVGFLAAVIGQALAETGAEPSRVVVAGYSNGAMMASRLACERADLVAQVVLVGATAGAEFGATCRPSRPVAVHVLAGTADTVVPLGGGRVAAQGGRSRGSVLALERFVALWTAWNGCSAWSVTPAPLPWAGVEHRSGGGCAAAVEVFAVQGGGHDWFDRPGGARAVDLLGAVTGP